MAKKLKVSTHFFPKLSLVLEPNTDELNNLVSKVLKWNESELFLATVQY